MIPKLIRMLMVARDLRVSDLARLCDTCERNIYFTLQGERKKPKYHPIISKALGISEKELSQILSDFKQTKQAVKERPMAHKESEA